MIDTITSIVIWILLFGPIIAFFGYIILADVKSLAEDYKPKLAEETTVETFDENEYEAFLLVRHAHESLEKQHACGYGPWLSCILKRSIKYEIVKDERGWVSVYNEGTCPPSVALTAVRWTMNELAGSRFDISQLSFAESALLEMGA